MQYVRPDIVDTWMGDSSERLVGRVYTHFPDKFMTNQMTLGGLNFNFIKKKALRVERSKGFCYKGKRRFKCGRQNFLGRYDIAGLI